MFMYPQYTYYKVFYHKKLALSTAVFFSLIAACCFWGKLAIRTSTPTRFTNETIDSFKLPDNSYNHQKWVVKEEIVALH